MVLIKSFYIAAHSNTRIPDASPSYDQATVDCGINGRYSCSWTIHALSSVISHPIKSVYPVVNGSVDGYIGILNTIFKPRVQKSRKELAVMWSHEKNGASDNCNWIPNHFVPLICKEQVFSNVTFIDIDDEEEFPPLSPKANVSVEVNSDTDSTVPDIQVDDTTSEMSSPKSTNITADLPNESGQTDDIFESSNLDITNLSDNVQHPYQNPTENSLSGTFLSVDKLFNIALNQAPCGLAIPRGIKENVYFVLDDKENRERRLNKKQSEYPDDCGAYDSKKNSTKTNYYVRNASNYLSFVEKMNGSFCKEVKKSYVVMDPQPDPSTIVTVKRKYSCLGRDNNYKKKRVTWFECDPEIPVAIVEYIGVYTKNTVHGNSTKLSAPYVRTTTAQKNIIRNGIESKKPSREIRRQANAADPDSALGPKVVHDAKHNNKKSSGQAINKANIADDILATLNHAVGNKFVREVVTTSPKKKPVLFCILTTSLNY